MRTAFNTGRMSWQEPICWCSDKTSRRAVNIVVAKAAIIRSAPCLAPLRYSLGQRGRRIIPRREAFVVPLSGRETDTSIVLLGPAGNSPGTEHNAPGMNPGRALTETRQLLRIVGSQSASLDCQVALRTMG